MNLCDEERLSQTFFLFFFCFCLTFFPVFLGCFSFFLGFMIACLTLEFFFQTFRSRKIKKKKKRKQKKDYPSPIFSLHKIWVIKDFNLSSVYFLSHFTSPLAVNIPVSLRTINFSPSLQTGACVSVSVQRLICGLLKLELFIFLYSLVDSMYV